MILVIAELSPTWGMSIRYQLKSASGEPFEGEVHNSIHQLDVAQQLRLPGFHPGP